LLSFNCSAHAEVVKAPSCERSFQHEIEHEMCMENEMIFVVVLISQKRVSKSLFLTKNSQREEPKGESIKFVNL
jgi:hypothetical protein